MKAKKVFISLFVTMLLCAGAASCGSKTDKNAESKDTSVKTEATGAAEDSEGADLILGRTSDYNEKYTLYLGLNDKDTYEQIISTEDALEKANEICARHAGGYTQLTARGGWTNDDGTMGHENTLVYIVYDISEDDLKAMLDEFLTEFNQSSVLVEKNQASHIYYSGS